MKELSIEEKAKAYDNIIEKANKMHCEDCEACQICIEELIPELAEYEGERIRKRIINALHGDVLDMEETAKAIAWLEKQGKKPIDKVEPKFNVGDTMRTLQEAKDGWIDGMPMVVSIDKEYYHCTNELIPIKDQDDYEYPPMNRIQKPAAWSDDDNLNLQCCIDRIQYDIDNGRIGRNRELLTWLKSLKDRVQPQPKQEWSEEDKNRINRLIAYFEDKESFTAEDDIVYANWLKFLKDRYTWKPSDAQIKVCKEVYADILSAKGFDLGTVNSELNRLEKQLKKPSEE